MLVEAPAGCGKTYQAADYARELAGGASPSRLLILTHTHAACSVFAERTKEAGSRVQIRTNDSFLAQIASAYHKGLGLPADIASWILGRNDGHAELASKVRVLLEKNPMIAASIAQRHACIICDEHQDSTGDQHSIIMDVLRQGAKLRIFGDPMQKIFESSGQGATDSYCDWDELKLQASEFQELDTAHRWSSGCRELGEWVLSARSALKAGERIDLRGDLPASIKIVVGENQAKRNLQYSLWRDDRKPIDTFAADRRSLLILTRHNQTADSFRSFFNRRVPLWEGHTRRGLENLVQTLRNKDCHPVALAAAVVEFITVVGKGFSPSQFGNRFVQEVREGCTRACRGKPAAVQELARLLLTEPNHRGVARVLGRLRGLIGTDTAFAEIEIDHHQEFREAIQLGAFDGAEAGLASINNRRTYARPKPPEKAISTIHKAKGLECDAVIVMPVDATTFPDKRDARCLLYVALSRAKKDLLLVISRSNPSPLLII